MRITNLTNSPYDILDAGGNVVRLPARGSVSVDPHPQHVGRYRALGYFRIEDDDPAETAASNDDTQGRQPVSTTGEDQGADATHHAVDGVESLRDHYLALSGKNADKRWSEKRLATEIEKLKV